MLDWLLMKELLLVLCKISRKEEYVGPFLPKLCPQGKNLNYKKLRKFDFISFPHLKNSVGVKSLYFICLVSDIENVLSKEHKHCRKTEIHINWMNSLSKRISTQCFPPTWIKIWVCHTKCWKSKKSLGIYYCFALLYILQNEEEICFISCKCANFRLTHYYTACKSEEAVRSKPIGNTANIVSLKEQRWSAIHPYVALGNTVDQKQKNMPPNRLVVCNIPVPGLRLKAKFEILQMLR